MDGLWDCEALDQFFNKVLRVDLDEKVKGKNVLLNILRAKVINMQSKEKAFDVGKRHYDIGNELYRQMLDKRMTYTCGYWKNAKNLDDAQESKLELTCNKIKLKEGMKILDIGCGWGSFAKYAAEKHGAEVVGVTVSKEQVELGNEICRGLPVEIRFQDYRDVDEKFDAVVSIGMFEHVGPKNHKTYMKKVSNCLEDDGLFILHTIGRDDKSPKMTDPWINKYIFPNSVIPSAKQITSSTEGILTIEDWHNFGADYDKTLMSWNKNFQESWSQLKGEKYDERFKRMWEYYLLHCAGLFRARKMNLYQIVFSKKGVEGGYKSLR